LLTRRPSGVGSALGISGQVSPVTATVNGAGQRAPRSASGGGLRGQGRGQERRRSRARPAPRGRYPAVPTWTPDHKKGADPSEPPRPARVGRTLASKYTYEVRNEASELHSSGCVGMDLDCSRAGRERVHSQVARRLRLGGRGDEALGRPQRAALGAPSGLEGLLAAPRREPLVTALRHFHRYSAWSATVSM
jgi:hypothetical protein